jgi:putative transposase
VFTFEVDAHRLHDLLQPGQVPVSEYLVPDLRHENQMGMQGENAVSAGADAFEFGHKPMTCRTLVRLRYNFRVYPTPSQQQAFVRSFGCARVVFNDGLRLRQRARQDGDPYISDGRLSKRVITDGKKTPGTGLALRGVGGGVATGAGGPEHRVPQLLHLGVRQGEGP